MLCENYSRKIISQNAGQNKEKNSSFLHLILCYVFVQGSILFVSGRWWDDWCMYNISWEGMKHWTYELGRPDLKYLMYPLELFTPSIYKILSFMYYGIIVLCFRRIVEKALSIPSEISYAVAYVFIAIPAFEARIYFAIYPYIFYTMLFMLAFVCLIEYFDNHKSVYRIVSLILFFVSFFFNSLLVFYGLLLLYIFVQDKKIWKYIDYGIIPLLFFFIKCTFFSTHGVYSNYNSVSIEGIVYSLIRTPKAIYNLIIAIFHNEREYVLQYSLIIVVISCIVLFVLRKRICIDNNAFGIQLRLIIVGLLVMYCGLFPYIVVRQATTIYLAGAEGRDYLLPMFGMAMLVVGLAGVLFKEKARQALLVVWVLTGTIFFEVTYSDYQLSSYITKGFQLVLEENDFLSEKKAILVVGDLSDRTIYELNGMAEEVYHNENRIVFSPYYTSAVLNGEFEGMTEREWYNMSNYDYSNKAIDVVIDYTSYLDRIDLVKLKIYEVFNKDSLEELIKNKTDAKLYYPGDDMYNQIILEQT